MAIQDARLVIEGAGNWAYTVYLTGQTVYHLGRGFSNDIKLDDALASNRHADLAQEGGRFVLRDRASSNGTYVNGERVKQHTLQHNDEIRIGRTTMVFMDTATRTPQLGFEAVELDTTAVEQARLEREAQRTTAAAQHSEERLLERLDQLKDTASGQTEQELEQLIDEWPRWREGLRNQWQRENLARLMAVRGSSRDRLQLAIDYIAALFDTDCAFVMTIHPETGRWVVRAHHGEGREWETPHGEDERPPLSFSVVEKTVQTGQLVCSRSDLELDLSDPTHSIMELEINSWICAPLHGPEGKVTGVLYLDRRRQAPPLERALCPLAETLAAVLRERL